ncbi:hypothetical protein GCM10009838_85430 [Catenulispora subtropica]|uniref:Uncharacterized protein n=1 Tax=Catenulispora subtropica TaxID=450798 RepID=A0ABN2TE76_9ACTN
MALPVPEQSGVTTDHRPDGVVEVWLSKPSQNTTPEGHEPPLGGLEEGVDGELGGGLGVPSPLHATPLNAKPTGVVSVPEYAVWKPKLTVAPEATDPL